MNIGTPQLFKVLSDPTRLRCVALLASEKELCVCELTQALELPQPKISHHLGALRKIGLVSDRKEGLWVHYRISNELPDWFRQIIDLTVEGIKVTEPYISDQKNLQKLSSDSSDLCCS